MSLGLTLTAIRHSDAGRSPRPGVKTLGLRSVVLVFLLLGCCGTAGPRDCAAEAARRVAEKDHANLRALLVDDGGRPVSASEFMTASLDRSSPVVTELTNAGQGRGFETVSARYRLDDGQAVLLESSDGEFRVRWGPLAFDCPATIGDALTGLQYAVERGVSATTASMMSNRLRTQVTTERRALLEGLQFVEELDVEVTRGRTQVTLPTGHIVFIVKQLNCWRIDEVR